MDELEIKLEKEKAFIRDRITELRIKADVSEYQMSVELGQSHSYIQSISSGRALPSMAGFLNICDYFGITPAEFFDISITSPKLLNELISIIKDFSENDLEFMISVANRIKS